MRRRSKPKVVWLPPTNANSIDSDILTSGIQAFRVDVSPAGPLAVGEIPLTIDGEGLDPLATSNTLSDIYNSGYRLRRIVGKVWVRCDQVDDSNVQFCIVTAGIIVRRVDPITGISLALTSSDPQQLAPSEIENFPDPWVWRRSWYVQNNLSPAAGAPVPNGPETNFEHGPAVADGPHVDQKTARRVGLEERLFLDVSVRANNVINQADQIPVSVLILTDLRILASLTTSTGNRRNASR